jgi:arsenate reductase
MVRRRIEIFTSLPFDSLDRLALNKRLDEIGDTVRTAP